MNFLFKIEDASLFRTPTLPNASRQLMQGVSFSVVELLVFVEFAVVEYEAQQRRASAEY